LLQHFSREEVTFALNQMHPLKSLGLDGYSAAFYQKYWYSVRGEVCKAVLSFLNRGRLEEGLNCTNIVLISKVHSPKKGDKI
jgi:hypothetical protein